LAVLLNGLISLCVMRPGVYSLQLMVNSQLLTA
jgi:hypothetical protein